MFKFKVFTGYGIVLDAYYNDSFLMTKLLHTLRHKNYLAEVDVLEHDGTFKDQWLDRRSRVIHVVHGYPVAKSLNALILEGTQRELCSSSTLPYVESLDRFTHPENSDWSALTTILKECVGSIQSITYVSMYREDVLPIESAPNSNIYASLVTHFDIQLKLGEMLEVYEKMDASTVDVSLIIKDFRAFLNNMCTLQNLTEQLRL